MSQGRGSKPDDRQAAMLWELERHLPESHAVLWTVIIVASVFDILTTMTGLANGLSEGNLVARAFIETYGDSGLGLLKFSALVVLVLSWWRLPDREGTLVLAGFAIVSLFTVLLNAITLAPL